MTKNQIVHAIIEKLKTERATLLQSARAAHEAATHEESKAEDQYDTRGIEASYLAGAQAQRALEVDRLIAAFSQMEGANLTRTAVGPGALIEVKTGPRRIHYLLVGEGGGLTVEVDGQRVNLITPHAPLGEALLGKTRGDWVELEVQGQTREYEITRVS